MQPLARFSSRSPAPRAALAVALALAGCTDGGAAADAGADSSVADASGAEADAAEPEEPFAAQLVWPVAAWIAADEFYADGLEHSGSADFAVPYWTPVGAARDGVVTFNEYTERGGHTLYIEHDDGFLTVYSHFSEKPIVDVGEEVATGQVVGYSGRTGNAFRNGAHLHFAIFKGGERLIIPDIALGDWVHRGEAIPGTWGELSILDDPGETEFEVDVVAAAPLRAEPTQAADEVGSVSPGERLTVTDSDVGYFRVAGDGGDGWLVHTVTAPPRSELQLMRCAADVAANVRSGPSTGDGLLGTIPRGDLITTFEKQGEWYQLLYGLPAVYGWTHESNVEPTTAFTTRIRTQGANVRSGPSIDAEVVGSLELVDVIVVDQTQEGWYRIDFDGAKAWVAGWLTQGPM